jgi:cytochrome c
MDGFEVNKILGAFLATCMFTLALSIVAGGMFAPKLPAKPGYDIAVVEQPGPGASPAAQPDVPIAELLAKADAQKGASVAKKCLACHTFDKGGPNKVGPNLWGIIGRDKGGVAGFAYSANFKKMQGRWTFDELSKFLANPKGMVPGTSMALIGLARPTERADVIAYLNAQSDSPQPLPKAPN